MTFSAMSQSTLQLFDASGIVQNGSVFHVWGDTAMGVILKKDFTVKNNSGNDYSYKLRKSVIDTVPGSENYFCFNSCYQAGSYSSNPLLINAGIDTVVFTGDYEARGHLGESIITYNIYNTSNPDDSIRVFIHYHGSATGIDENDLSQFYISKPFPNPAVTNVSFNYSFPAKTAPVKFQLLDLTGKIMNESALNNNKGTFTINTKGINNGIYFCSFYADNRKILTRKIAVYR